MPASTAGEVGGTAPTCLWQGDAFHQLAGFTPCLNSLLALAQPNTEGLWTLFQEDPAMVLLLLRHPEAEQLRVDTLLSHLAHPQLVQEVLQLLEQKTSRFVDFQVEALAHLYQDMMHLAKRCRVRAEATLGRVDPVRAWIAGLFAPLGWLTVSGAAPHLVSACRLDPNHRSHPQETQRRHWGIDQDSLARQMARRWNLPSWLCDVTGRLRLTPDIAVDLGAHRGLFEVVQQATIELAREGNDLGLVLLDPGHQATQASNEIFTPPVWRDPFGEPLLPLVLRLALENRQLRALSPERANLEEENDRLHTALANRLDDEQERHRNGRLQAVAELAAGAGHEINNPLAVISGQAQYLLGHRQAWFQPEAIPSVAQALDTIIGQTRRIHTLLRHLMLFARPPAPQPRSHDLYLLIGEVVRTLEPVASATRVELEFTSPGNLYVLLDGEQFQAALTAVLRNGIEAQPNDGWVRIGVGLTASTGSVEVVVEDGGPGPTSEQVPFLFDPFFSGRTAGRGKGLGLPVAWQLIRQQGGDLRYARTTGGPTRFVILFPSGIVMRRSGQDSGGEAA